MKARLWKALLIIMVFTLAIPLCACAAEPVLSGDYYMIGTKAELEWFRDRVNVGYASYNAKLTADIDLEGSESSKWTPIGKNLRPFQGIFDGQGHSVTGLYIKDHSNSVAIGEIGFIGRLGHPDGTSGATSAEVKNLIVSGDVSVVYQGISQVGIVVGKNLQGKVTNCAAIGRVTATANKQDSFKSVEAPVGAVVGYNEGGTVVNCSSTADVTAKGANGIFAGGIVGWNVVSANGVSAKVTNCAASGDVTAENTDAKDSFAGGIVGCNYLSTVENCAATCNISGDKYIGGVVGYNAGAVKNCGWLDGIAAKGIGSDDKPASVDIASFDNAANVVTAYTIDPAASRSLAAGESSLIFRSWPGMRADAISAWNGETLPAAGLTASPDTYSNTKVTGAAGGNYAVMTSLSLTATKFGSAAVNVLKIGLDSIPPLMTFVKVTGTTPSPVSDGGFKALNPALTAITDVESVAVSPMSGDNKGKIAESIGISSGDMKAEDNSGMLVPTDEYAKAAAQDAISGTSNDEEVSWIATAPICSVDITKSGDIATFAFEISGDKLRAKSPDALKVVNILAGSKGELFKIAATSADYKDEYAVLLKDGKIFTGTIVPTDTYTLCAFIKDGGSFDLDGKANGEVCGSIAIAETKSKSKEAPGGSSGGCSAGFAALALAAVVPVVVRRKKQGTSK